MSTFVLGQQDRRVTSAVVLRELIARKCGIRARGWEGVEQPMCRRVGAGCGDRVLRSINHGRIRRLQCVRLLHQASRSTLPVLRRCPRAREARRRPAAFARESRSLARVRIDVRGRWMHAVCDGRANRRRDGAGRGLDPRRRRGLDERRRRLQRKRRRRARLVDAARAAQLWSRHRHVLLRLSKVLRARHRVLLERAGAGRRLLCLRRRLGSAMRRELAVCVHSRLLPAVVVHERRRRQHLHHVLALLRRAPRTPRKARARGELTYASGR